MEQMVTEPSIVLEALKILTTASYPSSPDQGPVSKYAASSFDHLLENRLLTLKATLSEDEKFCALHFAMKQKSRAIEDDYDIRWTFVMTCLHLLEILSSSLEEANKLCSDKSSGQTISPSVLGVSQQKTVLSTLQFIVCLGICPNLQTGVGVPLEKRTGFMCLVSIITSEKMTCIEKNRRLFICVKTLLSCIIQPSLGSLILSRHLGDLLAVLLQICFGSLQSGLKKGSATIPPQTMHDKVPAAADEKQSGKENPSQNATQHVEKKNASEDVHNPEVDCFIAEIQFCEEKLKNLLERVYQPLVVRELLVLQGGAARKMTGSSNPPLPQAPVWLRGACGRLLSDILMKPQGVHHILRGMLDGASGESSPFDWRKCDAVAMVISNCPMKATSVEAYYKQVSSQILALLEFPDRTVARQFLRVACSTINTMSKRQPALAERFILQPLLKPLYACTEEIESPSDRKLVVVNEEDITSCIENIHKICVSGSGPQVTILTMLVPISPVIFQLYCAAQQSVTHLRSACHEILVALSKQLDHEQAMSCFKVFAFPSSYGNISTDNNMKQMHSNVTFAPGMKGGIVAVTTTMNDGDPTADNKGDACIQGLIALLKDLQVDGLAGEFFLYSLNKLTAIIAEQTSGSRDIPSSPQSTGGQELLDIELKQQRDMAAVQIQIQTLNLLAAICESLGPSCLKSSKHVLEFVKVTLERCVEVCRETDDDLFELFETETLTMAMGLLTAMLAGGLEITNEDRGKMNELLPLFEQIATSHPDQSVKEMAADIRVAIATHGVVWSELLKMSSKNIGAAVKQVKENRTVNAGTDIIKGKPKIEVTSDEKYVNKETSKSADNKSSEALKVRNNPRLTEQPGSTSATSGSTQDMQKSKLREVFEELCDPHIPVRGHALIVLTKLVQAKDKETLEKHDTILKIFLENLSHEDTYLYLSSVNGLVALANIFPDVIIPKLATQFSDFQSTNKDNSLRIKLGECLVKASRNLGDMIPKYRDVLLPAILSGCRDQDPLMRASSLSNLGELCKLLRFSLGNVINEIFQCCSSLLKSDSEPEVRKAACLVITMLLQGSARDTMQMLGPVLRDVYRLLKLLRSTEKDDGVLFHVQLAMDELDTIMNDYLFPKQTLTKKIHVLDPMDNDFG